MKTGKTKKRRNRALQWLRTMPGQMADKEGDISIPLTLSMDASAWLTYARGAKAHGMTIEEVISDFLQSEDCEFENRGYKSESQAQLEEERDEKPSDTANNPPVAQKDPADWWKEDPAGNGS